MTTIHRTIDRSGVGRQNAPGTRWPATPASATPIATGSRRRWATQRVAVAAAGVAAAETVSSADSTSAIRTGLCRTAKSRTMLSTPPTMSTMSAAFGGRPKEAHSPSTDSTPNATRADPETAATTGPPAHRRRWESASVLMAATVGRHRSRRTQTKVGGQGAGRLFPLRPGESARTLVR